MVSPRHYLVETEDGAADYSGNKDNAGGKVKDYSCPGGKCHGKRDYSDCKGTSCLGKRDYNDCKGTSCLGERDYRLDFNFKQWNNKLGLSCAKLRPAYTSYPLAFG